MNSYFLRSIIYGGTDGIITMFNIVSGVKGANLPYYIVFFIGIASLLGDALSMGVSSFLSTKAELDYKRLKNNNKIRDNSSINGLVTFISFILFGAIPLLTYLISTKFTNNNYFNTVISTTVALFLLGSTQSHFTNKKWYQTGSTVTIYGLSAAFLSFLIARIISNITPSNLF